MQIRCEFSRLDREISGVRPSCMVTVEMAAGMQWVDPEHATASAADAVAGTVACRGYMWANQHPAPRVWRALVGPKLGAVGVAAVHNHAELAERAATLRMEMESAQLLAVQVVPYARLMAGACPGHPAGHWLPIRWKRWWKDSATEVHGGGLALPSRPEVREYLEDPIED
jgi:hypothetical protein